jgi:hypothetical protein
MALAGVKDVIAPGAHGREQALDRRDGRAREGDVVAHLVDVAARTAVSVCISMMMRQVLAGVRSPSNGQA